VAESAKEQGARLNLLDLKPGISKENIGPVVRRVLNYFPRS
jgi:hypothetical protein